MAKAKAPVAMQFKRPGGGQTAKAKQKRKARRTVEIVRPWTAPQFEELAKEDRDIVLDRLQKEVAAVPPTRSHAVLGVNQVARAVARGELRVVVFANNPESLAFGHLPLLCRLHQVPVCVLHLSSRTFGRLFQLKSVVAVGIRAPATGETAADGTTGAADDGSAAETSAVDGAAVSTKAQPAKQLTQAEQKKLESITEFLISKASKRTS
ncbi:Ribosomal protein L7Ae/L30e/S12e/Gadd45 [Phytophthora cinnamomi]|uniref:Ribosomal protein L7Ae/L30e/S12e/Gadd45 n=1 Tax=Phytophthora cinnamomi TaxID=4785 RepID=UPI00355A34CA|nr:Ribosomal protein L7Ae/L30e/S12e/Gadd45 [Phytophthora cinnamomi]